ncbi:MAG TPA: fibronectin type III domain-containing protein, partial [Solirubrobacterales bacterium]|nr:fibronectin type III domain-containing protein [Solirubrobacterales bacterium]
MKKSLTLLLTAAAIAAAPAAAQAASPTILSTSTSATTTDSVVLEAEINPQGKATKYRFEYGPADCAASPCESTPELQLASGGSPVTVSASVGGLDPGTTYHFRAIATHKEEAAVKSPDRLFATYLPPQSFGPCPNDQLRTE